MITFYFVIIFVSLKTFHTFMHYIESSTKSFLSPSWKNLNYKQYKYTFIEILRLSGVSGTTQVLLFLFIFDET